MGTFRRSQAAQVLLMIYSSSIVVCWNPTFKRREALQLGSILPFANSPPATARTTPPTGSSRISIGKDVSTTGVGSTTTFSPIQHPFYYTDDWVGTKLSIRSLEEAVNNQRSSSGSWDMGKWPDPILRTPAADVDMDRYQGSDLLRRACDELRATAIVHGAVGLAAQQCGVNARLIYLQQQQPAAVLVNPTVLARSPEPVMRVWRETCLVFPPSFRATVLRDAWVLVEFQDWRGQLFRRTLHGETARALQHEMDHDRGILITDHIDEAEMENDIMRAIERPGHETRMRQAYDRYVV
jgi:peptide deformylase